MDPIQTTGSNFTYRGPTPEIGDLHCRVERDGLGRQEVVFAVWKFTDEERALIAAGANIELGLMTPRQIPPVSLEVVHVDRAPWTQEVEPASGQPRP